MSFLTVTFACFICVSCVFCQNDSTETTTMSSTPSTTTAITPTKLDNTTCSLHDDNCNLCLDNKECYYCENNKKCHAFAVESLLPDDHCPMNKRNIGTCKMSYMVVMILVGVASGIVVIGIICCCCCCCKRSGRIKLSKDDLKWARQREERKMRSEEKRQERAARTEEIRRKYGLFKGDTPYQRFDA